MDAGKCWGFGLSKQQGPNSGRKSSMTRNRGLNDILITVVGGLHGFPGAIESVYPQTQSTLPSICSATHWLSPIGKNAKPEPQRLSRLTQQPTRIGLKRL